MFGPILLDLVGNLLANLLDCDQTADGADAKATVQGNHHGDGRYSRRFFGRVARAARQEAAAQGVRITRKESFQLAQATLDHIRDADPTDMTLAIQEMRGRDLHDMGMMANMASSPGGLGATRPSEEDTMSRHGA